MPEAVAAPAVATPPPVSQADAQRAQIARENGTTYNAESQTFSEPAAEQPADGTTPATPASGEPAQNAPEGAPANPEAQGQDPTPVEGGGDEGEGSEGNPDGQQEPSNPGKNNVARKIDRLTKENAQMKRAFAEMLQRQQQGQPPVPPQQQPQQPQQPAAEAPPDPTKYTDVAQYIADTAAYNSRQETRRVLGQVFGGLARQAQQQQAIQQAQQTVSEFNQRVSEGAKGIKDFGAVTAANSEVEVADHVATSIMHGVDNPAVVLYHLAKNPAEVAKLNSMPPAKVAVRLGEIQANARRPAQPSNAPRPGTPVVAKGGASGDYDSMSEEAFMAARNARK